jgi:hypothetical protein
MYFPGVGKQRLKCHLSYIYEGNIIFIYVGCAHRTQLPSKRIRVQEF